MDPNDIDDYGYAPNGSNQGTSDFGFGTAYTGAYPNSPSTGGWNTQGQHRYPVQTPNTPNTFGQQAWGVTQNQYHVDSFPVQTPNTPHTFSRQTLEQQLQPSPNSAPPQTIKIRGLNQEGRYTNARLNPTMRRSYITLSFAASLGFSLDDLLPFQPGNYGEEWTRDGGPAPSRWVTVNIAGHGPFRFQETRENVAIYPLSESPGSNAGLIMGWELWQKLYPQQGDGNDPAPGSRHHTN
ncbi:hypothetical protein N0V84_010139 [Fusarium piperis]|uniref:Uncharacterized protein n=1 Tax=Fusarium piperis TaxID=1435070 RepID=A0A9W8W4Z6_9HYPO|nr:hypothetical protein N0V84_010139 [Fusarium piperis]